jgi:4-aminobutyrate aminotransferase-like enzyme
MNSTLKHIYGMTASDIIAAKKNLMVGGGTPGPTLEKGKGVRVTDSEGKSYIDCTSQSWALSLGYGHDEIISTLTDQMNYLTHVHQGFDTKPRFYLAREVARLAPEGLNRVSFTVGGGPAIEAAMKICLKNRPGTHQFVSQYDSYHGTITSTAGASWIATRANGRYTGQQSFMPLLHDFARIPNPYCYRCIFGQEPETCDLLCAEMLEHTLIRGVNGPAAGVIIEPLQASGGQIPAPRRYLQRVREICDEFDVPLIFDEIQTFCRIGRWFAAEHYEVIPDIIVLGKSFGGGLPLAAIVIHDKLEGFSLDVEELHTFANNSVAQVCAIKQMEIISRDNLLENTRKMGKYIGDNVETMKDEYPEIGDVRAVGLHVGVEFVSDPESKTPLYDETVQIRSEGMERGAIFGLGGVRKNVLKIKPPFIITKNEADEVLDILKQVMQAVLR